MEMQGQSRTWQEREIRELQRMLHNAIGQLNNEKQRADDADRKALHQEIGKSLIASNGSNGSKISYIRHAYEVGSKVS